MSPPVRGASPAVLPTWVQAPLASISLLTWSRSRQRCTPTSRSQVADVEALPFEDGSFEAVVCNFGLGHFPRAEYAMAECVRVLCARGASCRVMVG